MGEEQPILIQIPRFSRGMKAVAAVLAAVWALEVVLATTARHALGGSALGPMEGLSLIPSRVVFSHQAWRLVTYAILQDPSSVMSLLGTVFTVWWFGSPLERDWGAQRVFVLMGLSVLAGGLLTVAAGFLDIPIMTAQTVGMSAPGLGLVVAWGLVHATETFSFFGVVNLDGRRLAALAVVLAVVFLAVQRSGANVAALGGALVAWAMVTFLRRRTTPGIPVRRQGPPRLRAIEGGRDRDRKKQLLN